MNGWIRLWNLHRGRLPRDDISEPITYRAWKRLCQSLPARNRQDSLFDRLDAVEWDVLLILDACRYDVLRGISKSGVVQAVQSPVSSTPEFLNRARSAGLFENTTYVSANPQTADRPPGEDIAVIPAHEDGWNDRLETVLPQTVFELIHENCEDTKRVVGHLLQPHYPHICEIGGRTLPVPNGLHPGAHANEWLAGQGIQAVLSSGAFDLSDARKSYEACTRYVWDHASSFAADLAADGKRVVLTSDHGELFGERGLVEHPVGVDFAPLTTVPWVVFEPECERRSRSGPADQLEALGYM